MRNKFLLILLVLFCSTSFVYGQMEDYNYKRELLGVDDLWHKVELPDDIFKNISQSLNDIRIYGINAENDTIEAPYLLRLNKGEITSKEVDVEIINTSSTENGYYFTFEVVQGVTINELKLDFKQQNFDWKLKLEGSQNQQEWFSIVDDYRILSIKNSETEYQFTDIVFPDSKYRYFRVCVKSDSKPDLVAIKMTSNEVKEGVFKDFEIVKTQIKELESARKTEIEVDLDLQVPVSSVKINVKDNFDYYRKVKIQYLSDSTKTEKGWMYSFRTLTEGMLTSIETNEFKFESTILNKLKIIIYNLDNEPLHFENVAVKGYQHDLLVRFTEPADYYLTYGKIKAKKPNYEISQFVSNIPESLTNLELGVQQIIPKKDVVKKEPLFKNKNWLWGIMIIIIGVLGWFSIKMMKTKD